METLIDLIVQFRCLDPQNQRLQELIQSIRGKFKQVHV